MDKMLTIILSLATFLNSITIILNFLGKAKKPADKIIENKFKEELAPIQKDLKEIKNDIRRLDKNQCKNYLTEFLEDLKKGVEKTDVEKQRATEVYDHYIKDLHLNSYIHDEWQIYMKKGEK